MKKMRRLIPAIAMLLVSAVMLSTASFAWFTMNESVTATGMEVKAKASGNLLIKTSKMTAIDKDITAEFTGGKSDIAPITFGKATTDATAESWIVPTAGNAVDTMYGTYTGAYTVINAGDLGADTVNKTYFAEYVVYLATAGEEMTGYTIYADAGVLSGIDEAIAPAYSVAFYVGTNVDENAPDAHYNWKQFKDAKEAGTKLVVASNQTIPSTFEKTTTEQAVGLKVTMRFYVDGALEKEKITVESNKIESITAGTTFKDFKTAHSDYADFTFYMDGAVADTTFWNDDTVLTGYSYWDGESKVTQNDVAVNYVNNNTIPTASTSFEIIFSANKPSST